ncbi:MAG: adenosylcobinamide-GDP ribazoletransferase [Lachnospiraceae bacterium]|nr:adenosylcobinamide-GDP ribazoletransferase [Lachnospiraceae bacterium]
MLKSLIIAFATYSQLPMPHIEWDEKSMKYSMCFFPLVGAFIGLCSIGCLYGMHAAGMGKIAVSGALTALPVLLSGGIHMDGFLDTIDARRSYQTKQEKLRILKDPHAGAFAIIYGIIYVLLCLCLFSEITEKEIMSVAAGYVLSRILSAISVVTFPKAKGDGMAAQTADAAGGSVKWILFAELLVWIAVLLFLHPLYGAGIIVAGILCFAYYRSMSHRLFGGITGDLAGWFLQVCEGMILLAVVIVSHII